MKISTTGSGFLSATQTVVGNVKFINFAKYIHSLRIPISIVSNAVV